MNRVYYFYRFEHSLYEKHLTLFAIIVRALIRVIFSCDISYKLQMGENCTFPHYALGAVIHPQCKMGNNVLIGAGAVVVHDVPQNAVVAGIPVKVIKIKE